MYSSILRSSATSLRDRISVPCDFMISPEDHRAERLTGLLPAPSLCEKFVRQPILSKWSNVPLHAPLHPLVTLQQSYRSPRETEEFVAPVSPPCESSRDPDRESVDRKSVV